MLQRKAQMLETFGRRRVTGVLALVIGAVGLLGMAQAAQAGTVTKSGSRYVYTSTTAANNSVDLVECLPAGGCDVSVQGNFFLSDGGEAPTASPASRSSRTSPMTPMAPSPARGSSGARSDARTPS